MKLLKKTLVAAGIAAAVFATGAAQAATINNPSTAVPQAAGKTIINESVRTVITPFLTVVTLGAGESLSIDDSVTFTLNAGTFATIAGGNLTSGGAETYALVSGGTGSNTATFRVTGAASVAAAVLTLTGHTITGTGVADNSTIMVTVDMSGFVGGAPTALYGTPITQLNTVLVPALTTVVTAAAPGTFDVATGFSSTVAGYTPTTGVSSVPGASVVTAENGQATTNTTTVGAPLGTPTVAATLLTISGPMAGVGSIASAGILGTNGLGVGTTPASTGIFNIDAAANKAWGTQVNRTTNITLNFDGTTAYDASAYRVDVSMLPDVAGGYNANANIGGGTIFSFNRNGSAFTTNSFGALNKLTVTDRSGGLGGTGADGGIAISAFDAAGNAVTCGAGLVIPNIANNGTVTVEGADIQDNCPGAKRIEGVVNSTNIYVSNTKKTEDGATSQSDSSGGSQVDI